MNSNIPFPTLIKTIGNDPSFPNVPLRSNNFFKPTEAAAFVQFDSITKFTTYSKSGTTAAGVGGTRNSAKPELVESPVSSLVHEGSFGGESYEYSDYIQPHPLKLVLSSLSTSNVPITTRVMHAEAPFFNINVWSTHIKWTAMGFTLKDRNMTAHVEPKLRFLDEMDRVYIFPAKFGTKVLGHSSELDNVDQSIPAHKPVAESKVVLIPLISTQPVLVFCGIYFPHALQLKLQLPAEVIYGEFDKNNRPTYVPRLNVDHWQQPPRFLSAPQQQPVQPIEFDNFQPTPNPSAMTASVARKLVGSLSFHIRPAFKFYAIHRDEKSCGSNNTLHPLQLFTPQGLNTEINLQIMQHIPQRHTSTHLGLFRPLTGLAQRRVQPTFACNIIGGIRLRALNSSTWVLHNVLSALSAPTLRPYHLYLPRLSVCIGRTVFSVLTPLFALLPRTRAEWRALGFGSKNSGK
ncbi:hypothetical protein BDN72DRAFT_864056 [Pluteus cervinus]|uniref:Uncharacterized protein n=1 Tax=Pluteus cervinus TaxID=181527 RepID=A0ACD3A574_9AGAR|nr:hypothetical protein BDN72DRAFT_864056 [Pluteus cervinus]